jgi:probable selenium-dependent hydroxylase accessory protein YqeC
VSGESLSGAIGLRPGQTVAAVGGGGKTSLLKALARECAGAGWRPVIMTTTTHILAPEEGTLLLGDAASVNNQIDRQGRHLPEIITLARARSGEVPVSGGEMPVPGGSAGETKMKLCGFISDETRLFRREGGALLVEADGSRGLPIKAPGPDEPVIPPEADIVLGVVGLDALGAPIDEEHAFRPERLAEVVGLAPGRAVDAAAIGRLAAHPEGLFRGAPAGARRFIILNKSDRIGAMDKLEEISYIMSVAACAPEGPAEAVLFTSITQSGLRVVFRAP